jgi:group I intron endonuclease
MITVSKSGFPRKSEVDAKIARMIAKINLIYCFYFPQSGKMYFGQTGDFWHRLSGYRTSIKSGNLEINHPKLFNALMKYDFNFTITIVAMNIDTDKLDDTETSYIAMFDSYKDGYNGTAGGKVLRGEDNPMWGKTHNPTTRAQMSESRMGDPRPKSVEWCQEHSEAMKGEQNPNYGGLSVEHKKNLSIAKIDQSIQYYESIDIDITPENIQKVLNQNNNNMRKTALDIGCTQSVVRRFCIRNSISIEDNMNGDNNPKRIAAIQKHRERGIDITTENIQKVLLEENNNVAKTAKKIGCAWRVINAFVNRI